MRQIKAKLQRLYRKKLKKGSNSVENSKFKNLRKPFLDTRIMNWCAKNKVSTTNDKAASASTYIHTYIHAQIHTNNGVKTE